MLNIFLSFRNKVVWHVDCANPSIIHDIAKNCGMDVYQAS